MINSAEAVQLLLREIIRIPSPYFQEQSIADYVHQFMENTGLSTFRQMVADPQLQDYEGKNIIGLLDAGRETTILIKAHMDTVYPTSDWKTNPYEPYLLGDRHAGIPTVIFGPDGQNLHAGQEEVSLKILEELVAVLVDFSSNTS